MSSAHEEIAALVGIPAAQEIAILVAERDEWKANHDRVYQDAQNLAFEVISLRDTVAKQKSLIDGLRLQLGDCRNALHAVTGLDFAQAQEDAQ